MTWLGPNQKLPPIESPPGTVDQMWKWTIEHWRELLPTGEWRRYNERLYWCCCMLCETHGVPLYLVTAAPKTMYAPLDILVCGGCLIAASETAFNKEPIKFDETKRTDA